MSSRTRPRPRPFRFSPSRCSALLLVTFLLLAGAAAASDSTEGPAVALTDVASDVAHPPPECNITCVPLPPVFGLVPSHLTALGEGLFFVGDDGVHGAEPWVSDGTETGTFLLADLCPGDCASEPLPLGVLDRQDQPPLLFFSARTPDFGRQPWVTDGTVEGTRRLDVLCPEGCSFRLDEGLLWYENDEALPGPPGAMFGGEFLFGVWEPTGPSNYSVSLYASDGTTAGTRRVLELCSGSSCFDLPVGFVAAGNGTGLFFLGPGDRRPLWFTDGTAEGTQQVGLDCPAGTFAEVGDLLTFSGGIAYRGECREAGEPSEADLYYQVGTQPSVDLGVPDPGRPVILNTVLWVIRNDETGWGGRELWRAAGSPEGGLMIRELDQRVVRLESTPTHLYLVAQTDDAGVYDLFASNGYDEPEKVSLGTLPAVLRDTVRFFQGRAVWFEMPAEDDPERHRWNLVSHGRNLPSRIEQSFSAPVERPVGDGEQLDLHPRLEPVGGRLFLGANGGGGNQLWVIQEDELEPSCFADPEAHCLRDGRFQVTVRFTDHHNGGGGTATPEALSRTAAGDTGYFWFFRPDNLELAVKVLDGRGVNGHWWVFSGGTTDLGYELEVRDIVTDRTRLYVHEPGNLCSVVDTAAFAAPAGPGGTAGSVELHPETFAAGPAPISVASPLTPPPPPECDFFSDRFACVGPDDRFSIQVDFVNQHAGGVEGEGFASPTTADTATVRFFPNGGVETMIKVLDGRPVNGHWWVLWGGLTNLGYTVRVLDRETEEVRTFTNPVGSTCGGADTTAFAEAP